MLKKVNKLLLGILLVGLILRLWGVTYGFPFIYSVDEPALQRSAYGIRFEANPHHFDWPHLHFYINYALYMGVSFFRTFIRWIGLKDFSTQTFPLLWRDPLIFYFSSRVLNALMGALTVIPIFLIGRLLFNKKVGYLTAFAMAIFPYHVWNSHFALVDVPMTFWFVWSVYFSSLILKTGQKKFYMLAGIFAGLSASTKYNGGYAVLVIVLASIMYMYSTGIIVFSVAKTKLAFKLTMGFIKHLVFLAMAGLASLLAFFAGTPFALFDFDTFTRSDGPQGAFWQFSNVGKVSNSTFFTQLQETLTTKFPVELGLTFLIIFELYFIYLLFSKKTKEKLFIFLPGLIYFLYITSFAKNRIHYYMLTFPFICLVVGFFMNELINSKLLAFLKNIKLKSILIAVLIFIPPFVASVNYSYMLSQKDTRNVIYDLMPSVISSDKVVYYVGSDLDEVMKKAAFKVKKVSSVNYINSSNLPDYVIISTKSDLYQQASFKSVSSILKLEKFIDSKNKLGPSIYIFSFVKEALNEKI